MSTFYYIVNMKTLIISTRLEKKEVNEIEKFARFESLDKSKFIKKLLNKSLKNYRINYALKLYSKKRVSLGKASEIAGINIWDFIEKLKQYRINLNYSEEDLRSDIKTISEL